MKENYRRRRYVETDGEASIYRCVLPETETYDREFTDSREAEWLEKLIRMAKAKLHYQSELYTLEATRIYPTEATGK